MYAINSEQLVVHSVAIPHNRFIARSSITRYNGGAVYMALPLLLLKNHMTYTYKELPSLMYYKGVKCTVKLGDGNGDMSKYRLIGEKRNFMKIKNRPVSISLDKPILNIGEVKIDVTNAFLVKHRKPSQINKIPLRMLNEPKNMLVLLNMSMVEKNTSTEFDVLNSALILEGLIKIGDFYELIYVPGGVFRVQ